MGVPTQTNTHFLTAVINSHYVWVNKDYPVINIWDFNKVCKNWTNIIKSEM
jgi:hypothetical protein